MERVGFGTILCVDSAAAYVQSAVAYVQSAAGLVSNVL
jgi:hypothetical protein